MGSQSGGGVVGAVDRDVAVSRPDEFEDGLLLAPGELELRVAAVGVDDDQVVLADGGRLEDRGVLADGDFEPAGVLQGVGQVECLFAVAVVLALAARQQEDLGAVRDLLLRLRPAATQATGRRQGQADEGKSLHGSGSWPARPAWSDQRTVGSAGCGREILSGIESNRSVARPRARSQASAGDRSYPGVIAS